MVLLGWNAVGSVQESNASACYQQDEKLPKIALHAEPDPDALAVNLAL